MRRFFEILCFLLAIASPLFFHSKRAYCQRNAAESYQSTTEAWQRSNSERLKGPNGWLALTAHLWLDSHWLDIGSDPALAGNLGANAPAGLRLQANGKGNEVRVKMLSGHSLALQSPDSPPNAAANRSSVDEEQSITLKVPLGLDADCPDKLLLANRYVLQAVRRNGRLALRIRDPESSAIKEFPGKFWF
nr:hypothetical protein [Pirellula sp.]